LFYNDTEVANLEMAFIHNGRPQSRLKAIWQKPHHPEAGFEAPASLNQDLLKTLGAYNVASKEWVIRQYDHEVQGSSVLKPLVGKNNDGPGDAAILRPVLGSKKGIIVSCGINPSYGDIDPYWMAASAIDESLRQIIAVGGNLERVALLDNFSWGDTGNEETLGALVRACQACYDLATVYQTPFISGKDSLNNEFYYQGKTTTIPHTLLISAIAVMEDSERAVTMDFKEAGNYIYIVGETFNELGGSEYYKAHGFLGNGVPRVRPQQALETMTRLSQATDNKLVRACHDLSDGGLGVALAEMAFSGELGAEIDLAAIPLGEEIVRDDFILFSESNSRFLVEVAPQHQEAFEMALADSPFSLIGSINGGDKLVVKGYNKEVINLPISELKEAWQKPLRW
ncbi:MAG: phosphoribosylformylglycinamidine synthase, partial [Chloroflexi bacterium]|nr:phosphoribosylformylglycinamidine synthase [Chloroflexota bacterium]